MSPMSVRFCNDSCKINCSSKQKNVNSTPAPLASSGRYQDWAGEDRPRESQSSSRMAPTQLQIFRGFANFYWRFIFSRVAASLTRLISSSIPFSRTFEATFKELKTLFTSAPVAMQPDPSRQFLVRHWLEGAEHLWCGLTKKSMPRFNFTLTYCSGSHNVKPDALARQHIAEDTNPSPDTILPPTCVVAALTCEIEGGSERSASSRKWSP